VPDVPLLYFIRTIYAQRDVFHQVTGNFSDIKLLF